ncbi:hypothetical protein FRIG_15240 [Frigoribacterium faeni]|nr:hypothetical protein [Frigoribacterium faeni]MCJ0702470.1 hypothetical protein [Frigoribacterium faeni]
MTSLNVCVFVFFFLPSRGLGDVYKRQGSAGARGVGWREGAGWRERGG